MSRSFAPALALLLLPLALVAAACGDATKNVALDQWVDGLCKAVADYDKAAEAAGEAFIDADLADTKAAKAAFAESLARQRDAQKAFRSAFADLGQPDIDGGKQVVDAFKAQFDENTKRTDDVEKRVAAIPDRADFLTEFLKIADDIGQPDFRPKLEAVAKDHPKVNDLIAAIEADRPCARTLFTIDAAAEPESEAWVSGICTALGTWVQALTDGADRLDRDVARAVTVAEVERILVDFFEEALTDTRALKRSIGQLNPPPVKDGQAIHQVFVTASDELVAAMERLTREARSVSFTSVAQAQLESDRLITLIDRLFSDAAATFDELQQYDPEGLDELFQTLPECQF